MKKEKYISVKNHVNGYSFANLGLFTGSASSIVNAVYSLVLLGIFKELLGAEIAPAAVGIYASLYALFAVFVGLFSSEILRFFTKAKLFYISMILLAACYGMMSFSVKPFTFISLDYVANVALTVIGILLPLFISDFSKGIGMEKLNARLHFWTNAGAFFAPMLAMSIVGWAGGNYRAPLLAAGLIYLSGFLFFKRFGVVQEDKVLKPVALKKVMRALQISSVSFFKKEGMLRAYIVNFGFYALRSMRLLYVPIIVIENGFNEQTLGYVLSIGILPYIVSNMFIGKFIKKYGPRLWLTIGFVSFAVFSMCATFMTGWALLSIFVLWQISGALMEASHDLLFFNGMPKHEQQKYYGFFRTSVNIPSVVAPILGTVCITIFNSTSAVWLITAVMAVLSTIVLWSKK